MRVTGSILALALVLGVGISCKLAERLSDNKNISTVNTLWPDVPPFPGATKTDVQIPLPVRLSLRLVMEGNIDFIAFRTDKSVPDVKDFYSKERMKATGWTTDEKGCGGHPDNTTNATAICVFSRNDNGKQEALAVVAVKDQNQPDTNIFYGRVDVTKKAR